MKFKKSKDPLRILKIIQEISPVSMANSWHAESLVNFLPLYVHKKLRVGALSVKANVTSRDVLEVVKSIEKWSVWSPYEVYRVSAESVAVADVTEDIVCLVTKEMCPWWQPWRAKNEEVFHRRCGCESNDVSWMLLYNKTKWLLFSFQPVLNSMDPNCCQFTTYHFPCDGSGHEELLSKTLSMLKSHIENESLELPNLLFKDVTTNTPAGKVTNGTSTMELNHETTRNETTTTTTEETSQTPLSSFVNFLSQFSPWASKPPPVDEVDVNLSLLQTSPNSAEVVEESRKAVKTVARSLTYDDKENRMEDYEKPVCTYQTIAVHCAAELVEEVAYAGHVDLAASEPDQFDKCGGWMFYNLDRDVLILHRQSKGPSTVQRFLCKGIIECNPRIVWETVKNPLVRFTYDDTAKKVDVIEILGEGRKIIHQQHESSSYVVRKSLCDFCVLQSERVDGAKLMLTLNSVEHAKCPVQQDVFRGMILPSGWVIEPLERPNGETHCVVTYYIQMDVGASALMEEIVLKQTQCISYLRVYIMPMSSLPST